VLALVLAVSGWGNGSLVQNCEKSFPLLRYALAYCIS
jgi:hypothetical protein